MTLSLAEVDADNLGAVDSFPRKLDQGRFVAPVVNSIAETYVTPTAWPRVVLDRD